MGRAYLDPKIEQFVDIDGDNIIRKTYVAGNDLIEFLRTKCTRENPGK